MTNPTVDPDDPLAWPTETLAIRLQKFRDCLRPYMQQELDRIVVAIVSQSVIGGMRSEKNRRSRHGRN